MSDRERELEGILERILAALHDASQIDETAENGIVQRIRTKPLLELIGDAVECPDCLYWQEHHGADLTDEEVAACLWHERESGEDRELDRRLRERP